MHADKDCRHTVWVILGVQFLSTEEELEDLAQVAEHIGNDGHGDIL